MFWGGFCLLPWLWLANFLLFRPYLARRSTPPAVHWYATRSLALFVAGTVLALAWYIAFVVLRGSAPLDWLTLVVPRS